MMVLRIATCSAFGCSKYTFGNMYMYVLAEYQTYLVSHFGLTASH